jgi:hypothetical protein
LEPDRWPTVISSLNELLNAQVALLLKVSLQSQRQPWLVPIAFPSEALASYGGHWANEDPWYAGAVRQRRVRTGLASLDDHFVDRRDFLRTSFFNEFLDRFDMDRLMNLVLKAPLTREQPEFGPTALSFLRARGREGFSVRELELLKRLSPHLVLAARNSESAAAAAMRISNSTQLQALNSVTYAVFGVLGDGRVIFANSAGEATLRAEQWVRQREGLLTAGSRILNPKILEDALG